MLLARSAYTFQALSNGWEEAWLLPEETAETRVLEALMAPWDPAGWEVIPVDWL